MNIHINNDWLTDWIKKIRENQESHLTWTNDSFYSKESHLPLWIYSEKHAARHLVYRNTHASWHYLLISGLYFKRELFRNSELRWLASRIFFLSDFSNCCGYNDCCRFFFGGGGYRGNFRHFFFHVRYCLVKKRLTILLRKVQNLTESLYLILELSQTKNFMKKIKLRLH